MFSQTDGANSAGLNYIRIPLGASDFSARGDSFIPYFSKACDNNNPSWVVYSLDDISGDTSFSNFDINRVPSYVFSVLSDIKSVNNYIKIHLVPWSPVTFCR